MFGIDACVVQVEVDVSFGLPCFTMVGLADTTVRESRDRVKGAIRNSGFQFPCARITVNLAPADLRKAGSAFDLAIALGILAADGAFLCRDLPEWLVMGELSLDGAVQSARGVLPIATAARRQQLRGLVLPAANACEAAIVDDVRIAPVRCLRDAVQAAADLEGASRFRPAPVPRRAVPADHGDFTDVKGQRLARRAVEIAAAGAHNVLLLGPPGSGKTLIARRMSGILPPLSDEEALECTAIHSVAGLLPPNAGLLAHRPFRAPHHTISDVALVGGGSHPRPGEISLAHNGVLFLDEAPEFDRHTLEVLRQPLEEGTVRIARAARTAVFPARFILVGAMNPCPCGYLGSPMKECRCTPQQVDRYAGRLSGPLRDRIDLTVEVPAMPVAALRQESAGESTEKIRERVILARERQARRFAADRFTVNARLDVRGLSRYCTLDDGAGRVLERAAERLALSARGHDRVLKVARTIADLAGSGRIGADHLAEALQFRWVDRPFR